MKPFLCQLQSTSIFIHSSLSFITLTRFKLRSKQNLASCTETTHLLHSQLKEPLLKCVLFDYSIMLTEPMQKKSSKNWIQSIISPSDLLSMTLIKHTTHCCTLRLIDIHCCLVGTFTVSCSFIKLY